MADDKQTIIFVANDDFELFDPSYPEKDLLRAVLLNAIDDLDHNGLEGRRALDFFLSPDHEDYLFSFRSICNHLDLDPNKVLRQIGIVDKLSPNGRVGEQRPTPTAAQEPQKSEQ
jgi:hypothetical protein